MKPKFFFLTILLTFVFAGCAVNLPHHSEPSAEIKKESGNLPGSYGPIARNYKSIQITKEVFQKVENLRKADRFGESELQMIARTTSFSPIAFSGCDLEVLKIFVAQNWVPAVVTISPIGVKHIRVLISYNDPNQQVTLIEPHTYSPAVISYDDFSKQWNEPQKTCLLVFAEYMGAQRMENVLRRYLPEEKLKSIRINVSNIKK